MKKVDTTKNKSFGYYVKQIKTQLPVWLSAMACLRQLYISRMEVDDVRRLKGLESENHRLKKLLAERDLEIEVMKEIVAKKW